MSDMELRQLIIDALDYDPRVDAAQIGIAVKGGIVTLTGHVRTYAEKVATEEAVRRIKGVKGVAQEMSVMPIGVDWDSDEDIARRAVDMIGWNSMVPKDAVKVQVQQGRLTLIGEVEWQHQRVEAENAIRGLKGIVSVNNQIRITARATAADVKKRIEEALQRDAALEAKGIIVNVSGSKVTLTGMVSAWAERQLAEHAAWCAPGVTSVEDRIAVAE